MYLSKEGKYLIKTRKSNVGVIYRVIKNKMQIVREDMPKM